MACLQGNLEAEQAEARKREKAERKQKQEEERKQAEEEAAAAKVELKCCAVASLAVTRFATSWLSMLRLHANTWPSVIAAEQWGPCVLLWA